MPSWRGWPLDSSSIVAYTRPGSAPSRLLVRVKGCACAGAYLETIPCLVSFLAVLPQYLRIGLAVFFGRESSYCRAWVVRMGCRMSGRGRGVRVWDVTCLGLVSVILDSKSSTCSCLDCNALGARLFTSSNLERKGFTQRFHKPLIKEYTLKHKRNPLRLTD